MIAIRIIIAYEGSCASASRRISQVTLCPESLKVIIMMIVTAGAVALIR